MSFSHGGDEVGSLVMDIGTLNTKAGFAGEDTPKAIFPSFVGTRNMQDKMQEDNNEVRYYVGHKQLASPKDNLQVESPFENGVISNWDHMERIIDHAYTARLGVKSCDHPILMTEVPYQPRQHREQMLSLLFDKFDAPAVFLAKNPVLSAFAHGKYTALVVDSGAYGTCVTPVHDGYALTRGIVRNQFAGFSLDTLTKQLLEKARKGESVHPLYRIQKTKGKPATILPQDSNIHPSYVDYSLRGVLHDAKEQLLKISDAPFDEQRNKSIPLQNYELLDGSLVDIGTDRFVVPERLFASDERHNNAQQQQQNDEMGEFMPHQNAVHMLAHESIMRCDADIRKDLYANLILTGGTTMIPGFAKRLENELQARAPMNIKVKPAISSAALPTEKKYSVWIGGSILASLGSFQQMWITKQEYQEQGAAIVHKKCP
ncbi:actin-like protein [Acrasis kona]|uniref:Actin-like protein n=1 Tax=Acrasis kona TaxID=1008807 RepID=A0AAW2ZBX7_9EUKA